MGDGAVAEDGWVDEREVVAVGGEVEGDGTGWGC